MSKKTIDSNPLQSLIFNTNSQKILSYFLKNPNGKWYDRELVKLTEISRAGTNLALRELAKTGLLHREQKGRMLFYSLNTKDPLVPQLKIAQNILELKPLTDGIKEWALRIVLYGSSAKGENREESDTDLFILTRNKTGTQQKLLQHITGEKIHFVVYTPQEWVLMETQNLVFKEEVEKGLEIWRFDEP